MYILSIFDLILENQEMFYLKDFISYISKMYKLWNEMYFFLKCDLQTDKHHDQVIHKEAPLLKRFQNWSVKF